MLQKRRAGTDTIACGLAQVKVLCSAIHAQGMSESNGLHIDRAGPCTDLHSRSADQQKTQTQHHMTPELGDTMRQHMSRHSHDSLSDRDDMDGLSDDDSDSDDGWLSEEDGKLKLAKNKVSLGHFKQPDREP